MIRKQFVPALLALLAGALLQPSLGAQQTAPQTLKTVIRSQSNLVLVDAVVTGKHNKPVLGLKQGAFRIYQDGKEQPITSFSVPAESNAHTQTPQYVLFFFDATTVGLIDQKRARAGAVKFVQKVKQPNLYFAAEDYTGVTRLIQNFTTNRSLIAKAVSEFKFGNISANTGELGTERFLFTLTNVCRSLGQLPGRKALVLLSGGFPIEHIWQDQLTMMIEAANRSNVTIYPIDAHGLSDTGLQANNAVQTFDLKQTGAGNSLNSQFNNRSVVPNKSSDTPNLSGTSKAVIGQELLNTLAEGTGGFSILNSNDYYRSLSKVAEDLHQYYTLGFVPPPNEKGVRYHHIEVKAEGGGLKVRAREGYYENRPRDLLAGKPVGDELLKDATGSKPGAIPVSISAPYFYLGSGKARVNVALGIPNKALHLDKSKGGYKYELNVLGLVLRPDNSVAKRFSEGVSGIVEKEQEKKFSEHPFDYRTTFQIAPGQYRLVMVLKTAGSEFGKATAKLNISPYDEHSLGLSGIALSDQIQPLSPLLASLRGQLMAEEGPLVAGGVQILPSPARVFSTSGTAAFYVQVYDPALLEPNPPKVGVRCEIINLKSNASVYESPIVQINSQAQAGSSVIPVAFKLPMEKLSPGKYRLSVVAQDSNGSSSPLRQENFSIQ